MNGGTQSVVLRVEDEAMLVTVRKIAREWTLELNFSLVEQTKLVTAASELARNMVVYGGGGEVRFDVMQTGKRRGLRIVFEDHGPGIDDMQLAMRGGHSSGRGMGLGLSGAKRLVHDFAIASSATGTRVEIVCWR